MNETETHTLRRDGEQDLRFTGQSVAHASTSPDRAMGSSWSGETGRWQTLRLFRTNGGKWICHRIDHTQWEGETDTCQGAVCDTEDEVIQFFGYSTLAKDLYESANIRHELDVD